MKIIHLNSRRTIFFVLAIILLAFLTEKAAGEQQKKRDYWPTGEWRTSAPQLQGMDSTKLLIADEFIRERLPDAFSLLVVKNGYLVFEKYYSWGSPEKYAVVHSVTKSVTSALIGIALEKGHLDSLDQKLIEFFPEYLKDEPDPRKKEISLKDLLTMSAGFKWNDRGPVMRYWYTSLDWAEFTLELPLENNPGDKFNYNSSISHLLSIILTKATKTGTLDFANQNLFGPLGISGFWHLDPQGYHIGGFGLSLTARDLAKIGFLYLNNGYWNGRSIVPENWVKESTAQQIEAFRSPLYGRFGYGFHWWVKQVDGVDSFRAWGRRGQFIVIVPELDLVIAVTSQTAMPHPPTSIHYSPLFDLVAASVKRERPPKKLLKTVKLPPDIKTFMIDYNRARRNKNVATIAEFISDRFLYNGVTKQTALKFISATAPYISGTEIVITSFEPEGDEVKIDVWLKDQYFESPFMTETRLIKENDQWKWYGNQKP
jgi:CubicO group peptidase (beta-lactamase class C family)